MCECAMCGRFDHTEHRSTIEAFQMFGVIYCEFCAQDALDEAAREKRCEAPPSFKSRFTDDAFCNGWVA